ncbi:hypothetical protein CR513_21523, partial [Mucuna pruriens]
MPSASLENQIPDSILFPKDKMYHVPPRVFGCVCFVHDVSPGRDKLSARAIKCVSWIFSSLKRIQMLLFIHKKTLYALPIPYLSSTESSSFETHNQDILQPSSSVHSQAKLSPLSISTCQSKTQEMATLIHLIHVLYPQLTPHQIPLHPHLPMILTLVGSLLSRKVFRSTRNPHPIYLSYHRLSPSYFSFVSSVSSITIPKSVCEALDHPEWRQAMVVEMQALEQSVSLPSSKKAFSCRWVFAIKVGSNSTVDRLKARLVAKGYTQVYGLDYGDTFSPVTKITIIHLLLAMATIFHWPLHQLDIKNAFFYMMN